MLDEIEVFLCLSHTHLYIHVYVKLVKNTLLSHVDMMMNFVKLMSVFYLIRCAKLYDAVQHRYAHHGL